MRHARKDYNRIQDPMKKIPENEPVFLLRAQDLFSVRTLIHYQGLYMQHVSGGDQMTPEVRSFLEMLEAHIHLFKLWEVKKLPDLPGVPEMEHIGGLDFTDERVSEWQGKLLSLESKMEDANTRIELLRKERESLMKQSGDRAATIQELKDKLIKLQTSADQTKYELKKANDKIKAISEMNDTQAVNIGAYQQKVSDLEKELNEIKSTSKSE